MEKPCKQQFSCLRLVPLEKDPKNSSTSHLFEKEIQEKYLQGSETGKSRQASNQ
jgi:hypothetical protein